MKKILVTGGLGYIGSHTVIELYKNDYHILIIDNLSNSSINVLDRIEEIISYRPSFEKIDLTDFNSLESFIKDNKPDSVIHFAALKAVGESVKNPLYYYHNNIVSLTNLLRAHKFNSVIFSSSCTVYGQVDKLPITENTPIKKAISPYGNTKQICEEIIEDTTKSTELNAISLRYFNPIGAHESAKIGELPLGVPQNLIPFITQTAAGIHKKLFVFGDDYPTQDGTAIRDYIDVVDLAKAHIKALERLLNKENQTAYEVFNIGTGKGNSVLDIINTFEKVSKQKLNYKIAPRRQGDITAAFADISKSNKELKWKAEKTLEESLYSAWAWQKKLSNI